MKRPWPQQQLQQHRVPRDVTRIDVITDDDDDDGDVRSDGVSPGAEWRPLGELWIDNSEFSDSVCQHHRFQHPFTDYR